ncbi:unnamed protein product [Phyllotreta striolata]|uniref:Uncharacterized protein n=1 Tax=Phyllotreta striolata TaxID=444603 RepID=A0A9N9TJE0_PHYSR|nr:unnamed protein product [Phyllotreta striolata]
MPNRTFSNIVTSIFLQISVIISRISNIEAGLVSYTFCSNSPIKKSLKVSNLASGLAIP